MQNYTNRKLLDRYDVYQHLMTYWSETMQDDSYIISSDGWKAELIYDEKAKVFECDLLPKAFVIDKYFVKEKKRIEELESDKENLASELQELEEENSGEEGFFADMDKVNKGSVKSRLKEIKDDKESSQEVKVLESYLKLNDKQGEVNKQIKDASAELEKNVIAKYKVLTEDEIKILVIDDKWMATLQQDIKTEMDRINQRLTQRIKELAERYETPIPLMSNELKTLEDKVSSHLERMGFKWN